MTRIIAGFAGSLALAVPPSGTRPTSDRVREAIFSALEARDALDQADVLDLYAGSGALGLEAASRGASRVTLVDKAAQAVALCRKNAATVLKQAPKGAEPRIDWAAQSTQAYLEGAVGPWDLVFLDPPYDLDNARLEHDLELLVALLHPDATVVVERSSRTPVPQWPAGLELDKVKTYGETAVYWLSPPAA